MGSQDLSEFDLFDAVDNHTLVADLQDDDEFEDPDDTIPDEVVPVQPEGVQEWP